MRYKEELNWRYVTYYTSKEETLKICKWLYPFAICEVKIGNLGQ
ncbi:MAG: hypothetical protein C5S49_05215 [Candidatus Methanogaster sp.]|nr:MAG: hypothetical protein C5S49_05215 [ANME-2 cluster archaeon]